MPPVATTVAPPPSSASMRSIMPSTMQAEPSITPLRMASMVFLPMAFFGLSRLMAGSCAVRAERASAEIFGPGLMQPPP